MHSRQAFLPLSYIITPDSPSSPGYSVNSQNRIHETERGRRGYLERKGTDGRRGGEGDSIITE